MTQEEAKKELSFFKEKESKLEKIISSISKEQRFWSLINGLQLKVDFEKYPNSIFLFSKNKVWVEYNLKSENLWLRYSTIWKVFEEEYDLSWDEIQSFIKSEVEKYFKIKGVTPLGCYTIAAAGVEKYFKIKGVTPTFSGLFNSLW